MDVYKELLNKVNGFPDKGSIVVESEPESLMFKDVLLQAGRKVVSDRDVFTLDYELTRCMSQDKGLRVLEDQIYPYLFSKGPERENKLNAINLIRNFPDPFLESELAEVLIEFFSQEEEMGPLKERMLEAFQTFDEKDSVKIVPRGFANLYMNDLAFDKDIYFTSGLLDSVPFSFSDKYQDRSIDTKIDQQPWKDQIDLYELCSNDQSLSFYNFDRQLDEVRCVLNHLRGVASPEDCLVLYPQNKGYEKLFYLYQREFFKEQVFFTFQKEEERISESLFKIKNDLSSFKNHYESGFLNKNKVLFSQNEDPACSLSEVIDKYFDKSFTEFDLNTVSHLVTQLGLERKLFLSEWQQIFDQEMQKRQIKAEKIKTDLNIHDYTYSSKEKPKEIWVLGWGEHLFKKTGDKLFSPSVMSRIEIDLGLELPSLLNSEAKTLFKNHLMMDSAVPKKILFSTQSFSGKSNKPGVFKILLEDGKETKPKISREKLDHSLQIEKKKLAFENKNLSASSLQKYDECPYKFYLEKVVGLLIEDEEDYFLSAKEEGNLIHKVLEGVKKENFSKDELLKQVGELLEPEDEDFKGFREGAFLKLSEQLWSVVDSEKSYLEEKNIVKSFAEKHFKFDVNLEDKDFKSTGGDFTIRGVVDRIDIDASEKALIYDYKRGDSGTHSLSRYSGSKLAPQLFLYCLAADHNFLGEFKDFVGFQYINVNLYKRQKGFVTKTDGKKMAKEVPHGSAVDPEKYQEKTELFLDKFWKVLERISRSDFEEKPNPSYSNICESCDWVGVCKKSETFV